MLSIAHGPTGAFITTLISNPYLATPIILASHYIEDRFPHWDVGQGITNAGKKKSVSFLQELFVDFPLSIVITYLLFQAGKPFNSYLWFGWFLGLLPTLSEFPRLFLGQNQLQPSPPLSQMVYISTKQVLGTSPQILLLLTFLLFR
jgi:hypothetical protein